MKQNYQGSCHCGAVRFRCRIDLAETTRCNCSICGKGRFWKAIAPAADFTLLEGDDTLTDYTFGSHSIHHRFCKNCGIKPFGRGELAELGGVFYAVNIACLDELSAEDFARAEIRFEDGRHSAWDRPPAVTSYL